MSERLSIISTRDIRRAFSTSIKGYCCLFYVLPIILGSLAPLLLVGGNGKAIGALNAFLTSFVPLFATILTFYMSWCYNKLQTRRYEIRLSLFRETSTCILMMIPVAALALVAYVVSTSKLFDCVVLWNGKEAFGIDLPSFLVQVTLSDVWRYVTLSAYYSAVAELLLILLMVCKRAHTIITKEIDFLIDENKREEAEGYRTSDGHDGDD